MPLPQLRRHELPERPAPKQPLELLRCCLVVGSIGMLALSLGCAGSSSRRVGRSDYGPAAAKKNPFDGVRMYLNPDYVSKVEQAAKDNPSDAARYRKVAANPTAIWLDSVTRVPSVSRWLDDAKKQQTASNQPVLTVFVVYDLPNRDCAAKSSAGELLLSENGEQRYQREFIDPIARQFRAHQDQPIVVILEPDSLANLATNLGNPRCAESAEAYLRSVAYAIRQLAQQHVSIYLDAAHAGWIGWDDNRSRMARIFKRVLDMAGGVELVRGFATNVANYNTLSGRDGKKMEPSNPCPDELSYVRHLSDTLKRVGIKRKGFIIDTARNGKGGLRRKWGSWCNVKGAGIGELPRAITDDAPLDAYFWVKPPGESDGVSDPTQPRFDASCRSPDSASGAPQAGEWFPAYFADLVRNAEPPL
jgi:cellulose 1,4-beta-cellobiosidase